MEVYFLKTTLDGARVIFVICFVLIFAAHRKKKFDAEVVRTLNASEPQKGGSKSVTFFKIRTPKRGLVM